MYHSQGGTLEILAKRLVKGAAKEKTTGLPYIVFVSARNDGRGAITQIERIAASYK